ncbi:unnamed protein product [Rhodiola kirilowii]
MSPRLGVFLALLILEIHLISASDPDPILDYCVLQPGSAPQSCKNSSVITVEDFIFSGIQSPGDFKKSGFSAKPVNSNTFPGLNTLGMSLVRADFDKGGVNVPHYHPRATEVAYVLEGRVYSGFVDTENNVFARVLEKGEIMVFPKGMVHFQMNVGDGPATIIGALDSQNPGQMKIPGAVFGSGVDEELLEKAFGLSDKQLDKLKKRFGPKV